MELVYLWVEKYKNIQEQGFNFSPKFECSYDEESKKLTIDEKEHIENFFGDNINVTAIVGENGTGKSNILNLIFNEHTEAKVFFIIRINTNLKVHGINLVDNKKYSNNTIRRKQIKDKIFECTNLSRGNLNDYSLGFYTPLLQNTFTDNKQNYNNKFNLSPSSLLDEYINQKIYKSLSFKNLYNIYESNNIQNIIDMIKHIPGLKLPFETPTSLYINTLIVAHNEKYSEPYTFLKNVRRSKETFYGYVEQRAIKNWFHNSFNNFYRSDSNSTKLVLDAIEQELQGNYSISNLIEIFQTELPFGISNELVSIDFFATELRCIEKFLVCIKDLSGRETNSRLNLEIENIPEDFMSAYDKVASLCSGFLEFSWSPELSSGQQTFLLQFALFYKNFKDKDNVLFMIDEGETTLHPNWQKMYIKFIIDFFNNNLKGKTIHIITSSHSPFILSDIPKENIIFLKNGEQVSVNIDPFGANIHTLLSHGFFMKDGLMGEFAKEKINNVYKFLSDKHYNGDITKSKAEQIIKIIGESVLKKELQKLFDKKNILNIDEQIKAHEDEIARLRTVTRNNND